MATKLLGFPVGTNDIPPDVKELLSHMRRKHNNAAASSQVTTPDATDAASAATLANDIKAKLNALIAALGT